MTSFEIIMALGASGMVIALIKFTTDRTLLIDTINYWKKQFDAESTKSDELVSMKDEKINNLQQEMVKLRIQLAEEKLSVEDLPFIYARMDNEARMIDFSNMYCEYWLKPNNMNPYSYAGKTSEEYWGTDIAKEWTIHDRYALKTNESFIGKESLMLNGEDQLMDYVIYKKPGTDKMGRKVLHIFIFDDKKILKMFNSCNDAELS